MLTLRSAYMDPTLQTGIKNVCGVGDHKDDFMFFRDLASFPCEFEVIMEGPADSPYANRDFSFLVTVTKEFPIKPIQVRCLTPFDVISRPPHFFEHGGICCHALSHEHIVSNSIVFVLNCIREIMFEPTSSKVDELSTHEIETHTELQQAKKQHQLLLTEK